MRKTLLSILAVMLIGAQAWALDTKCVSIPANLPDTETTPALRAPITNGFEIKFCGSLSTWSRLGVEDNSTYKLFIYVTPQIATDLAGNSLTEITFSAAFIGEETSHPGSVFVTEDIFGTPITSTETTVVNNYDENGNNLSPYNIVALETPYTIKEGQGFYFGYTVSGCTNDDYPIAVDNNVPTPFCGGILLYRSDGELVGNMDVASATGSNLYLTAKTIGDKKSVKNLISSRLTSSSFASPTVEEGSSMDVKLSITNLGSNKLTSVTYTIDNGNGDVSETTTLCSIAASKTSTLKTAVKNLGSGPRQAKVTITALNGDAIEPQGSTCSYIGLPVGTEGYTRRFVVEEGTGTWCGWCPRGIVGLDTMAETYPDSFIGIGVHASDNFMSETYVPLISTYFSGFPLCIVNRDPNYIIDPSYNALESAYKKWQNQKGVVEVEIAEAELIGEEAIKLTTNTTFLYDENDGNYALAYVVLEDGLIGVQTNYYANNANGVMGGWEKKGKSVAWKYTNTAINIYECWGVEGSVTPNIKKGVADTYTYNIPLTGVTDVKNTKIVVMLLDEETGVILNANRIDASDYKTDGITSITEDNDAPAEYYNLQGMRMQGDRLPAGIYIVKKGDKVVKSAIR